MFPEFIQGALIWQWINDWAGLIALVIAVLVIGLTVPYLLHQIFRSRADKNKLSDQPSQPGVTKAAADTYSGIGQTMDLGVDVSGQNTLNFQSGSRIGDTMNLGPRTFTMGRSPDNDIVIDDPTVSRNHARITFEGNQFYVEDLGSAAGTRVNGRKVSREAIGSGSTIKLGNTEIGYNNQGDSQERVSPQVVKGADNPGETRVIGKDPSNLTWLAGTAGTAIGQTYHLKEGNNILGRDAGSDVVLDDSYASRQHAMVRVEGVKAHLFDLGSSGGTRVNGKKINGGQLGPNSVIRVGETELNLLQVDDPRQFVQATMSGNTMVDRRGDQIGALVVKSGVDAGKSFMLVEGDNTIGRGNGSSISLSDESVSRQHAVVRCQNGKLVLFDVGSRSGTMLNGQAIGGHPVSNGDVISLGRSEFTMMASKAQPVGV